MTRKAKAAAQISLDMVISRLARKKRVTGSYDSRRETGVSQA